MPSDMYLKSFYILLVACSAAQGQDAATANCGGWFSKACPTTTTTTTTTTVAPPAANCGGWFQPACQSNSLSQDVVSPPELTTTPPPANCGGWFQSACTTTATTTTPAPSTTSKPCGGWFQSACPTSLSLVVEQDLPLTTTTPSPASSCGGWFQSACPTEPPTTPAPQKCGGVLGFFTHECETTTAKPTTLSKSAGWGLFGTYTEETTTTTVAPAASGWVSGLVSGVFSKVNSTVNTVKTTTNLAVGTAKNVTSKIVSASMNTGVDFFLAQIKLVVRTTGMDVVPLPDLNIPLYPGASLNATGGYFKSVLSISRGGDITLSRDGLAFILDFPVQLSDMEIGFKNYSITVLMGMGTSGAIKVGVQQNKINIRIRLSVSVSCAINVEKVDFAVLEGLDIQMTYGCSYCGYITDRATTYLANVLKNTIRLQIQSQIDNILQETLSNSYVICSKFVGM